MPKIIAQFDLLLELFPHCNADCTFCHQRACDGYKERYESIIQMPKAWYVRQCLNQLRLNNLRGDRVTLLGGELCYDNSTSYIDAMHELLDYLNPSQLNVTTNLLYKLEHSVLLQEWLKRPGFSISTSYNPVGRYKSQAQLELFEQNVKRLAYLTLNGGNMLSVEVVLQEDVLCNRVKLPFLDYIRKLNESTDQPLIDCIFLVDYRGYATYVLNSFNDLLLHFLQRYPVFTNVKYLHELNNAQTNLCACTQPSTHCLSYNNGFEVTEKQACIDQSSNTEELHKRLIDYYGCDTCEYRDTYCKDVCLAGLNRSGLLNNTQYCYQRFLLDKYDELFPKFQ